MSSQPFALAQVHPASLWKNEDFLLGKVWRNLLAHVEAVERDEGMESDAYSALVVAVPLQHANEISKAIERLISGEAVVIDTPARNS